MKKVKKILLGLSIPAAALAMSVGSMVTTPTVAEAGPCMEAGCTGSEGFCTNVRILRVWKLGVTWECNGTMNQL